MAGRVGWREERGRWRRFSGGAEVTNLSLVFCMGSSRMCACGSVYRLSVGPVCSLVRCGAYSTRLGVHLESKECRSCRFTGSPVSRVIGLSLHRVLGDRCGSTRRTRSAPRRISSQIRRGVRLKAQGSAGGSGPGACQMRVQIPRRSRAPPPPARGGMSVREFCVPVPVLHLLLPRQSHENPTI